MNRKIVLAAILPVSFFLVFLGMRIDVNGNTRPKQRPRAIVETVKHVEKAFQDNCSKGLFLADACKSPNVRVPKPCLDQPFPAAVLRPVSPSATILSSRAPPLSFSMFS
jgi:hypothetical protein